MSFKHLNLNRSHGNRTSDILQFLLNYDFLLFILLYFSLFVVFFGLFSHMKTSQHPLGKIHVVNATPAAIRHNK